MAKETLIYKEKYRKGMYSIRNDSLPILKHLSSRFIVKETYLIEAGLVEKDGERLEYQDIRVYMKESEIG